MSNVPWASLVPNVNTNGEELAVGYAIDFADRSTAATSFLIQTYPNGLPPGAEQNPPSETAFAFHIMAAATPLTRAEYLAQQTDLAATLRASILNDGTSPTFAKSTKRCATERFFGSTTQTPRST